MAKKPLAAVEAAAPVIQVFRDFIDGMDALNEIGKLDQAVDERKAAAAAALVQINAMRAEVEAERLKRDHLMDDAAKAEVEHGRRMQELTEAQRVEGSSIVETAKADAAKILADARVEREAQAEAHDKIMAAAAATLAAVRQDIEAQTAKRDSLIEEQGTILKRTDALKFAAQRVLA